MTYQPSVQALLSPRDDMRATHVPVSFGELADKITILEIKTERISDRAKLENVRRELGLLQTAWQQGTEATTAIDTLTRELKAVNEKLWEIEDEIRASERNRDFGPAFIELARAVYKTNDRRAEIKRKINVLVGSSLIEEKSYESY
jgi:hypothetical protein